VVLAGAGLRDEAAGVVATAAFVPFGTPTECGQRLPAGLP
jgi:hypothetical protein